MSIIISINFRKLWAILSIMLFISGFFYLFNLSTDLNVNFIDGSDLSETHEQNDFGLELSDSSPLSTYSGVGKAQNVTEYGNAYFTNYGLDLDNNDNASIIVPDDWKVNEIVCNISNIYDYNTPWVNETFDMGIDSWSNHTDPLRQDNVTFSWYINPGGQNDSISIEFEDANDPGTPWDGIDSYVEYTFELPRPHIPYSSWDLNYNFWAQYSDSEWLPGTGGAKHYCNLSISGNPVVFGDKLSDFNGNNNTIFQDSIPLFAAEDYGLSLPGNISLKFGVDFGNNDITPSGFFKIFFDNITLSISTIPKPSQINLNITDITNGYEVTNVNDIGPGEGTVTLKNIWEGDIGGKSHFFIFNSNSSGRVVLNSEFYTKATSLIYTKTQSGDKGCEFQVEYNTKATWTMYVSIIVPGTYGTGYYFNISKPLNWNVTDVIDPYSDNKVNDVIGTGYGNTSLTIPNHIITNGLWKFVAEAPNYVKEVNIYEKSGLDWIKNTTFYNLDKLKINASIETEIIPNIDETNASMYIYYPNGTLFYQENASVSINGAVEFSEITLGANNASVGKYIVYVTWTNYDDIKMSQVGLYKSEFMIFHKTSLTPVESSISQIAGEPLLLKVKFIDSDLNASIDFAVITYNSTFGSSGTMAYQGSGIYFIDIDTSSLSLGDYYFSFNASKSFYENQTMENLIHLNIIAQPLLTAYVNNQEIHEDYLVELSYNQELQISCRALAEIEGAFLSGGSVTFINGEYEVELLENADYWFNRTILISTSSFSIGPNYAYLRFQHSNYSTIIFTFQVFVNQMEINVGTPDFEGYFSGDPGETVIIKLNLTETGSTNYIENATVFYSWNFGAGYFNDIGSGIYELELLLPTGFVGSYDFELIISKEGILYKTKEFTFYIDINQVEEPNLLITIIFFALIAISGILGVLSLRSYVILPKRRKREAELISKIQVFKDVWNIRAVIIIHKESGLPIYNEEISMIKNDQDSVLISGFVQAITAFGETFVGKEFETSKKLATDYEYLKTIIDLDFKFFQLLVCDFETVRVLLILKDTASERLKKQLHSLASVLHSQFSEEFKNFKGSLKNLSKDFQDFLNQFLFLHFNREFQITPNKNYYDSLFESEELTNLEKRLINVMSSMTKINKMFTLKETIDLIEEKNEDLVLEALNSLISRKIIISPYSPKLPFKI